MKQSTKFLSLFLAVVMALGLNISAFAASAKDSPDLTIEMISDTHIGVEGADETVATALRNMAKEKEDIDGLVVCGDLSNDGTEENVSKFYSIMTENNKIKNTVVAAGNHDMGQMTLKGEETRPRMISYRNSYVKTDADTIFYSTEIEGYKFVILGDEGENINCTTITDEQIDFMDQQLAEGTKDGKPAFVICHWPPAFINGSWLLWPIWPGGNVDPITTIKLRKVLDKYDNVIFVSGHLHMGLNNDPIQTFFSVASVENHTGTTYITLPSISKDCRFGIKDTGTGMEFKIYDDKVEIYGRNYVTGEYYEDCTYTVDLV